MRLNVTDFGVTPDGEVAKLFCVKNSAGMVFKLTNYGGIVTSICMPDENGVLVNLCLGFDSLEEYVADKAYLGALIGRYANRIKNGNFELNGTSYQLTQNDYPHHLHGGECGFDKKIWDVAISQDDDKAVITFSYLSRDGEEGYPGNCHIRAIYEFNDGNEMILSLEASCDKATPINLTQHSYFNLAGCESILDHYIKINASMYAPINASQIPLGTANTVLNTPFDFSIKKSLSRVNFDSCEQTAIARGFNHYFFLNKNASGGLNFAARMEEPKSGRALEIFTSEPGVQFYTGGFLGHPNRDVKYGPYSGLCFEAQHCPDSISQPTLPSTVLHPGKTYSSKTLYKFFA